MPHLIAYSNRAPAPLSATTAICCISGEIDNMVQILATIAAIPVCNPMSAAPMR
jgi:hypothetical protein